MALQSPGTEISIIDESTYTSGSPGTVPLIVVTSAQNKSNAAGTGIAAGTIKVNAGRTFRVSSQRELVELFGIPFFEKDGTGASIHGSEINEYGLQAAYSYLGVSNSVYITRADVDLSQLTSQSVEPTSPPSNGQLWLDANSTAWGIQEWNFASQKFVNRIPLIITDPGQYDSGVPKASVGSVSDYAVTSFNDVITFYYKTTTGWVVLGSSDWVDSIAIQGGNPAELYIAPHTQPPAWKTNVRPTGSVWIKTTEPNLGAKWSVRIWNDLFRSWELLNAPLFSSASSAILAFDPAGGASIPVGTVYVDYDGESTPEANFSVFSRSSLGVSMITAESFAPAAATYTLTVKSSVPGSATLAVNTIPMTIGAGTAAADFAAAINSVAGIFFEAIVTGSKVELVHKLGGEIEISGASAIEAQFDSTTASNWELVSDLPLSRIAPTNKAEDSQLWFNAGISDVDIMVNDGGVWEGYLNAFPATNPTGPIVSATAPTLQTDGSALVANDLWIDSSDLDSYPIIRRYTGSEWVLVDNSDQVTEEGIVFADARYSTSGSTGDTAASIISLLSSDFVDADAPDPALYPAGILLWNLRRSSGNVKQYVEQYVDVRSTNTRLAVAESMVNYAPGRWVTVSANNADGSGAFGNKAQRAYVVSKLKSLVDSSDEIRDEERRVFNIISCPGYPELLSNLNNLNIDRGLTAFVVGDAPMKLASNTTSLINWAQNANGATSDGDVGLVSFSEYSAAFYPGAGLTTDLTGAEIVVPSSYMMLRTIALSDNASYPWYAPAGIRRGAITNATSVGYIDSAGEFVSVSLNEGQRDTLYSAKLNPITFFNGVGLVNYGQKTLARTTSALDRINVARLVVYLRQQLNVLSRPYVFEPNDRTTREEIKQAIESLLLELVSLRAIDDFAVVCDESNNTPARIDRNELYVDIAIVPIKAVEFIYIPLRVRNTGEL